MIHLAEARCYWERGGIENDYILVYIRAINGEAVHASPCKTGMIILGGGMPKHHICNANMMRNGADYAVFINTAQEFDGSDSGARPDEAVSWGKIRGSAIPVKVHCDATIAFPLLVAQTDDLLPSLPELHAMDVLHLQFTICNKSPWSCCAAFEGV
eukprot:Gb_32828 [translate_table: standard]